MKDKIQALLAEIDGLKAASSVELEALRVKYLSKKGEVSVLFNDFREVPNESKREVGQLLNELKTKAQDKL
ncbi:MAG: phenylalanine--tRNA ligase subunit alpha, partial [Paludibacter sp.]|nr:phenylalanine--tRNA ligase subunit alpha [Paludibacter sp.]